MYSYHFRGRACSSYVPTPNVTALEKHTYQYVGEIISVSRIHGGPSPTFLALSVVDYIVHGMAKVTAAIGEVPDDNIRKKRSQSIKV